ncbi:O-antigen ligase family protein [Arsenicicoccus cauae]|uniref:O-antigen ligase family protein n=1 Tax=Arsenicicoccus cauae TaxID=2663847 RepID=UPI00370D9DCB
MTEVATAPTPTARPVGAEPVPLYVWLMLAYLVANMFSGQWGSLGIPVPLDRVMLLGTLTLLLLEPARDRLRWRPVYGVMIFTALWTAWSALTANTLFTSQGFYALLDRIIVPFVMLLVGALVFTTRRRRDLLLKTLVPMGLYLGTNAWFTIVGPRQLVFPRYIVDFLDTNPLVAGDSRAVGPFLTGEANGFTMNLCMFAAGFAVYRFRGPWRWLALVTIPACMVGVMLTATRSAWAGALLGILAVTLLVPALRRWLVPAGVAVAVVGTAAVVAIPTVYELVTSRFSTSRSLYDRANTYEAGWRALDQNPLFGVGWSTFIDHGVEWVRQSPVYPITTVTIEIHNVFLSRAVETGLVGGLLWAVVCLAGPFIVLLRPDRRTPEHYGWWLFVVMAFFAWLVPTMTSPNPFPLPNTLVWLVAGIAGREFMIKRPVRDAGALAERANDAADPAGTGR